MFATARLRLVGTLVIPAALAALLALVAFSSDAQANHSWGNYHWRINQTQFNNQFTLQLGDNVSDTWDGHLAVASTDWSNSDVLNTDIISPGGTRPKSCKATIGRVEVCNATYGNNGWLGLAQIWLSGNHITQGVTKMNDTYFNRDRYNTPAWRQMVICQEVGHTFGLDHTDETNNNPNLGSCMDYTNDPDGGPDGASEDDPSNEHPGGDDPTTTSTFETDHDYVQLETIYDHYHTTTTVGSATAASTMPPAASQGAFNSKAEWGRKIRESRDGHLELWERSFGNGSKLLTWVIRP